MSLKKNDIILGLLRQDSKLSTREISAKIGVPVTTVHNRIKNMEKEGIIRGYAAKIDNKKIGKSIHAFVHVSVMYPAAGTGKSFQEDLANKLFQMGEVENCWILTGERDILLQVFTKDIEELNNFVIGRLRSVEGVQSTLTSIVMMDVSEKVKKYQNVSFS